MLDLKYVVDNREAVLEMLASRGQDLAQVQSFPGLAGVDPWALDAERRALIQEVEQLRHRQRLAGEEIARRGKAKEDASDLKAEMKGVAERVKQGDARLEEVKDAIERFLMVVPNVPDASVPVGRDETANVEVRRVGEPRVFDFAPKAHWDLGPELGILDFERAAAISGARFAVLWDGGARLERALIQFMLDLHTSRGYREVLPPYLVTAETLTGTGQLPKFEGDLFKTSTGDRTLYLIPTAEVPVTNLHRGEILDAAAAAEEVRGVHAVLPLGGRLLRQGRARAHPPAPVPQGRAREAHDRRVVDGRARGHGPGRRGGPEAALPAVPRGRALDGRHGLRRGEDLRHRGLAARPAGLPRDLVLLELHRLPGAARRACATAPSPGRSRASCTR